MRERVFVVNINIFVEYINRVEKKKKQIGSGLVRLRDEIEII